MGELSDWTSDTRLVRAFLPPADPRGNGQDSWPSTVPAARSRVVIATHSPVVASVPGARILELGDWGIRPAQWEDLEIVRSWRMFLGNSRRFLRYLLADEKADEKDEE